MYHYYKPKSHKVTKPEKTVTLEPRSLHYEESTQEKNILSRTIREDKLESSQGQVKRILFGSCGGFTCISQ